MSILLSNTSLTGPIWPTAPTIRENGIVVEVKGYTSFICSTFSPTDPLRVCAGDESGAVHKLSLRKNRYSVVARLNTGPITSMTFVNNADTIFCCSGMWAYLINVDTLRVEAKTKSPHFNNIQTVVSPASTASSTLQYRGVAASLSMDMLAVWNTLPLTCVWSRKGHFSAVEMSETHLFACETSGVVSCRDIGTMEVTCAVNVSPVVPTCMALLAMPQNPGTLFIGSKDSTNVFCLRADTLEGLSSVQIPSHSGGGISCINSLDKDVFCCQTTTDGKLWFVATQTFNLLFTILQPSLGLSSRFSCGDSAYCAVIAKDKLYLYHLPTAKGNFERTLHAATASAIGGGGGGGSSMDNRSAFPFVTKDPSVLSHQHMRAILGAQQQDASSAASALVVDGDNAAQTNDNTTSQQQQQHVTQSPVQRSVLRVPKPKGGTKEPDWVKANLINTRDAVLNPPNRIAPPKPLNEAIREMNAKKSAKAPASSSSGPWFPSSSNNNTKKQQRSAKENDPSSVVVDDLQSQLTLRAFLDHDSTVINMDKLRVMLMRYGIYPERYRPFIWRFLLQLPDKRQCAPQYANLVSKGSHPGVLVMMRPFPLPDNKLRVILERALSCLAHQAAPFSCAHFLPSMAFPFCRVFGSDIQSIVEAVLAFFINWGQEFFTFYPHMPVDLTSFISHTLKAEDPELWAHLDKAGVGAEVFVWEAISSLYSDIVTRNEWLQVIDHAFSNEPLWLWLFHVRWLVQIRQPLLEVSDFSQLCAMFRRAMPFDVNGCIQQTYRLHARTEDTALSAPYRRFNVFDESGYPFAFASNESVVTSKLRELEKVDEHEHHLAQMKLKAHDVQKHVTRSAMLEDAFVNRQRALASAKFQAANDAWIQQVSLEKERQKLRDIEHESRLNAVQEQLRSAQRIESLQDEVKAAERNINDAETDRDREMMQWRFADRMTNHEIERLEQGARMKLNTFYDGTSTSNAAAAAASSAAASGAAHATAHPHHNVADQSQDRSESHGDAPPQPPLAAATRGEATRSATAQDPDERTAVIHSTEIPQSTSAAAASSTNTTTVDSDPAHYYNRMHREVLESQDRQRQTLTTLHSQFVQEQRSGTTRSGSGADADGSASTTVTEEPCDDDDDDVDENVDTDDRATATDDRRSYDSTTASSITHAILRPHNHA